MLSRRAPGILTGCEAADQQRLQELFVQHGGKVKVSYTAPTDGSVLVVISSKTSESLASSWCVRLRTRRLTGRLRLARAVAQTNIITKKDRVSCSSSACYRRRLSPRARR